MANKERRVAIAGFAPNTLRYLRNSKADEIWSIVWAYKYPAITRVDRLFEIHGEVELAGTDERPAFKKTRDHWLWMQSNQKIPVYMQDVHPKVPMSVRYPIEDVTRDIFGCDFDEFSESSREKGQARWTRAGLPARIFTSTVDYMMALAIHEGFDVIEVYGIEISSDSEYLYQRDGYAFYHGFALGRGIRIEQQDTTRLLHKPYRYGYDRYQMISRQTLEGLKRQRQKQLDEAVARKQYLEGKLGATLEAIELLKERNDGEIPDNTDLPEMADKFTKEIIAEDGNVQRLSGAVQNVEYLLREIDLDENYDFIFDNTEQIDPDERPEPVMEFREKKDSNESSMGSNSL